MNRSLYHCNVCKNNVHGIDYFYTENNVQYKIQELPTVVMYNTGFKILCSVCNSHTTIIKDKITYPICSIVYKKNVNYFHFHRSLMDWVRLVHPMKIPRTVNRFGLSITQNRMFLGQEIFVHRNAHLCDNNFILIPMV